MSLRFRDPDQKAAIVAAAKAEGVSLQDYVLSAAYQRATAVQHAFLSHFEASMARSGDAFTAETDAAGLDPAPAQRDAERQARGQLGDDGQGQAA